jgi:hypothetical protein
MCQGQVYGGPGARQRNQYSRPPPPAHRECRNSAYRCACPLPSRRSRNLIPIEYRTTRPIRLSGTVKPSRKSRLSCQFSFLLCFFSPERFFPDFARTPAQAKAQRAARATKTPMPLPRVRGRSSSLPRAGIEASGKRGLETTARWSLRASSRHWRCALTSCRRLSAWSDIVPPYFPISSTLLASSRDAGGPSREVSASPAASGIRHHGSQPMASSPRINRASRLRSAGSMSSGTA